MTFSHNCERSPDSQKQLFVIGTIAATPSALAILQSCGVEPLSLVARHSRGDWGDVCADDAKANRLAVSYGYRVRSSYLLATGKVWVITEADRSVTTLLIPEEC